MRDIPKVIRAQPKSSDLLVVDERVPLAPLIRALGDAGFAVINGRTGKLVVPCWTADFSSPALDDMAPSNIIPMRQKHEQ